MKLGKIEPIEMLGKYVDTRGADFKILKVYFTQQRTSLT